MDHDCLCIEAAHDCVCIKSEHDYASIEGEVGALLLPHNARLYSLITPSSRQIIRMLALTVDYREKSCENDSHDCVAYYSSEILPLKTCMIRGFQLSCPQNMNNTLTRYYGKGWAVPTPDHNPTDGENADALQTAYLKTYAGKADPVVSRSLIALLAACGSP